MDKATVDRNLKKRYSYLWAFILGMGLMILMYVIFDATTNAEYRTRLSGDSDANPIIQTGTAELPPSPSAFLGVEIMPVDPVIAEQLDIGTRSGVLVNGVIPSSPADRAGLIRGDVIISLDNRKVKDVDGFRSILADLGPGDKVRIVYIRDGKRGSTYAELAGVQAIEKPDLNIPSRSQDTDWGVSLAPLDSVLKESFNIPGAISGVIVVSVTPEGLFDESGIKEGDVITGVDSSPVTGMDDFFNAVATDDNNTALLDIYSQGRMRYVPVDSTNAGILDQAQVQDSVTLRQRIFTFFTGGSPFTADEDEEEGPKGGKFADDNVTLTSSDTSAFNRPSSPPGEANATGTSSSGDIALNRPSQVPPQIGGPTSDTVLFIGLLIMIILYLAHREFHRPPEID